MFDTDLSPEDMAAFIQAEKDATLTAEEMAEFARNDSSNSVSGLQGQYFNQVDAAPENIVGESTDYLKKISEAVQPTYQRAIDKVNLVFGSNTPDTLNVDQKKLKLRDKAIYAGITPEEAAQLPEKDLDFTVAQNKAKALAAQFPNFIDKADDKLLAQSLSNIEAAKKININAMTRSQKSTDFSKFVKGNLATTISAFNTLRFLAPNSNFDDFAMTTQILDSSRRANQVEATGTEQMNQLWRDYQNDEASLVDIVKFSFGDWDGFKAFMATSANNAASVGASIAGGVIGAVTPIPGGTAVGTYTGASLFAFDAYMQKQLEEYREPTTGAINFAAMKRDSEKLKNQWRIEASQYAALAAAFETLAPRVLKGAVNVPLKIGSKLAPKVAKSIADKTLKASTAKAIAIPTKVATKGATEAVGEASSEYFPTTIIDLQNGRLDAKREKLNRVEAVQEGFAGLGVGVTMAPMTIYAESRSTGTATQETTTAPSQETTTPTEAPLSKPLNTQTEEERATSTKIIEDSEGVAERISLMEDDMDSAKSLEGMSDEDKINLFNTANSSEVINADTQLVQSGVAEVTVNGTDLQTMLNEDVQVILDTLPESRRDQLAEAIANGTDFDFQYGEWVVSASKLQDKHNDIAKLVIDSETAIPGYEAIDNLATAMNNLTKMYEQSLQTPEQGSTPPPTPGLSSEVSQALKGEETGYRSSIIKKVMPSSDVNSVTVELADGSTHSFNLHRTEYASEFEKVVNKLSDQFEKALKASGKNSAETISASVKGVPLIVRALLRRAEALGVYLDEASESFRFGSDKSSRSAYVSKVGDKAMAYFVGGVKQDVSTVAHEFAHVILNFMAADFPVLAAQKEAGNINKAGLEYLDAMGSVASILGIEDVRDVMDFSSTTLTHPTTGEVKYLAQSGRQLTKYTALHEKLATTMEVFLKFGELDDSKLNVDVANLLMYWRGLIPETVSVHMYSEAAKGAEWKYSAEYHQALDPTDEVGNAFYALYNTAQEVTTKVTPYFNINYFPVEMLGKEANLVYEKVIESKHLAVAKVFANAYSKAVSARNKYNTPENLLKVNKDIAKALRFSPAGQVVDSLITAGLRVPKELSDLRNAQDFMVKFGETETSFERDATYAEILSIADMNESFPEVNDVATIQDVVQKSFENVGEAVKAQALTDLGYLTDEELRLEVESTLAREMPKILDEQFSQLVERYPNEAKALFSAMVDNTGSFKREVNRVVKETATERLMKSNASKLKLKTLLKSVKENSRDVLTLFNQGRYLEAMAAKYEEVIAGETLRQGIDMVTKLKKATKDIIKYTSPKYLSDNARVVHPETMTFGTTYLQYVLTKDEASLDSLEANPIERLDHDFEVQVKQVSSDFRETMEAVDPKSVEGVLAIRDYLDEVSGLAKAAMALENKLKEEKIQSRYNKSDAQLARSTNIWDMRTKWLPQYKGVEEVFSSKFSSEAAYMDSEVHGMINDVMNGEAEAMTEGNKFAESLRPYAKKAYSKKRAFKEPVTLSRTGFNINSREELHSILLYLGSVSGRKTFLRSHNITLVDPVTGSKVTRDADFMSDINDLAKSGVINDADVAFVNQVWITFKRLHPLLEEVYRRDRGIKVHEVKAKPFNIGDMEFIGGYFPISYNEVVNTSPEQDSGNSFYNIFNFRTSRNVKSRGENRRAPVNLNASAITSYIQMAMREHYIKPPMQIFKGYINRPDMVANLRETRPGAYEPARTVGGKTFQMGIINDWVDTVENQIRPDLDPNESRILRYVQRNTSLVFYSASILSAITNYGAGMFESVVASPSKIRLATNAAIWLLRKGTFKERRLNLSAQMKANEASFIQFISREHTEDIYSNKTAAKEFIEKAAYICHKISQNALEDVVWNSAFEHYLAKGATEQMAIANADRVTRYALGRYALSNKTIGQKGGAWNDLVHMASMHLVAFNRKFNTEIHRDSSLGRRIMMGALITGSAIVGTAYSIEMYDLFTPDVGDDDEDEDKQDAKRVEKNWQILSEMLPYFTGPYGRVLSTIFNQATSNSGITITPAEYAVNRGIRAIKNAPLNYRMVQEEGVAGLDYRDYADVLALITMVTGIPASVLSNMYKVPLALTPDEQVKSYLEERNDMKRAYREEMRMEAEEL